MGESWLHYNRYKTKPNCGDGWMGWNLIRMLYPRQTSHYCKRCTLERYWNHFTVTCISSISVIKSWVQLLSIATIHGIWIGTWCSQSKTLVSHLEGFGFHPQSDLSVDFSAHRLKLSPLPKIKLWECEEYQAPIVVFGVQVNIYHPCITAYT
jgi:hypothetical protein